MVQLKSKKEERNEIWTKATDKKGLIDAFENELKTYFKNSAISTIFTLSFKKTRKFWNLIYVDGTGKVESVAAFIVNNTLIYMSKYSFLVLAWSLDTGSCGSCPSVFEWALLQVSCPSVDVADSCKVLYNDCFKKLINLMFKVSHLSQNKINL